MSRDFKTHPTVNGSELAVVGEDATASPPFARNGVLAPTVGVGLFPITDNWIVEDVVAAVGSPSSGAAVIVDVNKVVSGVRTSLFTTQGNRPQIAPAAYASAVAIPDITSLAPGDHLSVDIDQVGSGTPGSTLTVVVNLRKA